MTRKGVILLAFVVMSLIVGFMAGYRLRISEEQEPGRRYLPPVPERVAMVEYDGESWTW
jgi:hypothetical protein